MTIYFSSDSGFFHFAIILALIAIIVNITIVHRARQAVKRASSHISDLYTLFLKHVDRKK